MRVETEICLSLDWGWLKAWGSWDRSSLGEGLAALLSFRNPGAHTTLPPELEALRDTPLSLGGFLRNASLQLAQRDLLGHPLVSHPPVNGACPPVLPTRSPLALVMYLYERPCSRMHFKANSATDLTKGFLLKNKIIGIGDGRRKYPTCAHHIKGCESSGCVRGLSELLTHVSAPSLCPSSPKTGLSLFLASRQGYISRANIALSSSVPSTR